MFHLCMLTPSIMSHITDTKLVGPLTVRRPSALPRDLEQFISSAAGDKGIILFSLGTQSDATLEKHQVEMLADVFGRLEQRVIWKFKSMSCTVGLNTRNIMKEKLEIASDYPAHTTFLPIFKEAQCSLFFCHRVRFLKIKFRFEGNLQLC